MLKSRLGGVTQFLVLDNLKTSVIKNTRIELILNRSYYEMVKHYGTVIISVRPVKHKEGLSELQINRDLDYVSSA